MINFKKVIVLFIGLGVISIFILYKTNSGRSIRQKLKLELYGIGIISPKTNPIAESASFDYSGTFLDLEGNEVNLNDYKGKTLFINIWASWCGPCRTEMPYINSLYEKVKENDKIDFLMVAIDENFEKSILFVENKNFSFPIFHAHEGLNTSLFTKEIPMTVVVNPEGKIVFLQKGINNFDTDEFRNFLLSQ